MSSAVYPWQAVAWTRFQRARATHRVAHAQLIAGPAGTGVRDFSEQMAAALLCVAAVEDAPCGDCRGCRLYRAGTHPDAVHLEPNESGKAIPVDAVRVLGERLDLSGGGTKVALIDPAESMTHAAANSLLKTLEEPSGDTVLLLVTRRIARLTATIRSRCQRVTFGLPDADEASDWLEEQGVADAARWLARAGGAPLAALAAANADESHGQRADAIADTLLTTLSDGVVPVSGAAAGSRLPLGETVPVLVATVEDLLRLKHAANAPGLHRPDLRDRMAPLAERLDARALFAYLDALYRSIPEASSGLRADIQFQGLLADAAEVAGTAASPERG